MHWAGWKLLSSAPIDALLAWLRAVRALRLHGVYGVFPPHSGAPVRMVPVFQASLDGGATWIDLEYKYMVSDGRQLL